MFDSLKCAKMLMEHGLDQRQAEGVTRALKVQMNTHLVTKDHFEKEFAVLRAEVKLMFEMQNQWMRSAFEMQNQRIDAKFESFEKSMTIRMGSMLAGAVVLLSALQSMFFILLK